MRLTFVNIVRVLTLAAAGAALPTSAAAQEIPGGDNPFGVRESFFPQDDPPPPPPVPGLTPPPVRSYKVQFTPTATAANGLTVYGGNLGVVTEAVLPGRAVRLRGGYRRLDLDAADDRNRWLADLRLPLTRSGTGTGTAVALVGEYSHTTVAGSKYKISAAGDQRILVPVSIGVSGFYVANETNNDIGLSTSVTYAISNASSIDFGYRFPNDVETERDYSVTLTQLLFQTADRMTTHLVVGAARDRAVYMTLSFVR
jgi:hypothetical protein